MYSQKLNILLVGNNKDELLYLKTIFEKITIEHSLVFLENCKSLPQYLSESDILPDIIFVGNSTSGKGLTEIQKIKKNVAWADIVIGVYSESCDDLEIALISGANMHIYKGTDRKSFENKLKNAVAISWQYISDGLDRGNFIMSF